MQGGVRGGPACGLAVEGACRLAHGEAQIRAAASAAVCVSDRAPDVVFAGRRQGFDRRWFVLIAGRDAGDLMLVRDPAIRGWGAADGLRVCLSASTRAGGSVRADAVAAAGILHGHHG